MTFRENASTHFFPQVLLLFFAGATPSLLLPSLPPTMLPTHSVGASGSRSAVPLPFVCWCLLLVMPPPRCAAASCCPQVRSPPPLAVPLPLGTPLSRVAPLLFGWLSHFPAPHLPLVAPPPGASASTIHYASTFCRAPLVRLVIALPSASTPISSQLRLVPRC